MRNQRSMPRRGRSGRTYWAPLVFLAGFAVLIAFVSNWYLLPAFAALRDASPEERRHLVAHSRLLVFIILVILLSGLLLTFRVGRFFLPRSRGAAAKPTEYVDAWSESGRRMKTPGDDD